VSDGVRLADLLAGLSLISDHGLGLPPDDAVRSCLVATALARKLDLPDGQVAAVFYDSLFEHIGWQPTPEWSTLSAGTASERSCWDEWRGQVGRTN
jgi:hypothetical protein